MAEKQRFSTNQHPVKNHWRAAEGRFLVFQLSNIRSYSEGSAVTIASGMSELENISSLSQAKNSNEGFPPPRKCFSTDWFLHDVTTGTTGSEKLERLQNLLITLVDASPF